ncbi:hypothetical protein PHISCL_05425 [Aspergillus sclerotialis]|uniref:Uncharacterized protein n=1 Tax=Aspergillus sclerotialis TaxID=2070753 RepID=A0A3A2ZGW8_9EURO|nr:hypothetical protein PHISCL_05425 [Aspergillus sclerotialis]
MGSLGQTVLDQCIIHGFGYLGSRITGVIEGTRRVQKTWKSADDIPFRIVAIVERDPGRLASAKATHPEIPCFEDIKAALAVTAGPSTFIKDFTSPIGRERLLDAAKQAGVPALLEKPLSTPGVNVSLAGRENDASVSMSEAFNPVIRALADKLAEDALEIHSLSFVRVNSVSLQRLMDPSSRQDIIGGSFVDKMAHDVHLLVSGALLGPANVDFGSPQINEIAFDLLNSKESNEVSFSSLNGTPLSPKDAAAPNSNPSDMTVDLSMQLQMNGRSIPTRWIASWCGVPNDLATRLGIPAVHVEAARVVTPGDPNAVGRAAYARSNMKLIVCNYINKAGEEVQLISNIQARGPVSAWLVERRNGEANRIPIRYCVSIVESMKEFSRNFRARGYLNLASIEEADRTVLDIRAKFRKPLEKELSIARSLSILDRNHGGQLECGKN